MTETPIATKPTTTPPEPQQTSELVHTPQQRKLVTKLQDSVDENGRYSNKLKDFSLGYAAGKGITELQAKSEVSKMFAREIGQDLPQYLEQNRIDRGLPVDKSQGRSGR